MIRLPFCPHERCLLFASSVRPAESSHGCERPRSPHPDDGRNRHELPLPIEVASGYLGMLWGEATGRGRIATRGQRVTVVAATGRPQVLGRVSEIGPVHVGKWHRYAIEAQGNRLIHRIENTVAITSRTGYSGAA